MNGSFNDNEYNIRLPDQVKTDQLLEDTRSDFDIQIDEAIYLSFQDFRNKQELNRKYEEKITKDYNEESNKRKQKFDKLLFDLNKVGKLDKDVREIYDIIDPIINSYCSQYINKCELDVETYEKIFKLLGNIRTDKEAVDFLKTIILNCVQSP